VNLIHHCEHHLGQRASAALASDRLEPNDPLRAAFRGALQSRARWDEFEAAALARPEALMTNGWVRKNSTMLRAQTQGRERIPPVYSNGAVEKPLTDFRQIIAPRAFVFATAFA
jgi:hypothetical protein